MDSGNVIGATKRWVETVVIGLNLCPFAARELRRDRVRFAVSAATDEGQLLADLQRELERLDREPEIETTLLIHPRVLQAFDDYNQFLDVADALLLQLEFDGLFQIASFHPEYRFGGTGPDDVENFTNRSPYPLLHLLRESSLERAIDAHPDVDAIPERNIERLEALGREKVMALLDGCFGTSGRR